MDYIKIRFIAHFEKNELQDERTVDEIFRSINPLFSFSKRFWKPQMDIYETPGEVIILAEIAGVDKKNLNVEISNKAVKIYGERTVLLNAKESVYRIAEIQHGKFERSLFLPAAINIEKMSASYSNGMLQIRLEKLSPDKVKL